MVNLLINYILIYINKLNLLIKFYFTYNKSWYKSAVQLIWTGYRIYTHSYPSRLTSMGIIRQPVKINNITNMKTSRLIGGVSRTPMVSPITQPQKYKNVVQIMVNASSVQSIRLPANQLAVSGILDSSFTVHACSPVQLLHSHIAKLLRL